MQIPLIQEVLLLVITFIFSVVGGITGIGIATIIIPLLLLMDVPFPVAKSLALWINVWIMALSVYKRFRYIKWHFALPLVISAFLAAPVGATLSFAVPERFQLLLLGTFVVFSGVFILFLKPVPLYAGATATGLIRLGILVGLLAGLLGGLLGIGGGIIANPLLIILGLDPLMVTSVSALMVFLSSLSGWATYTAMGYFPLKFALPLAVAAFAGSFAGNKLSKKMSKELVRKVVAIFALFVGVIVYLKAITL